MSSTVQTDDGSRWLTFDEVVAKLRFPSRHALFSYLRRHPAPVYQRVGSRRYFMKPEDVDQMMAPIDLRVPRTQRGREDETSDPGGEYVEVDASARTNGKKFPHGTRSTTTPTKTRRRR